MTDWLKVGYKDAQGCSRRIASGATKQAIIDYAAKQQKTVEDFASETRTRKLRSGSVVKEVNAVRWYGLLSA